MGRLMPVISPTTFRWLAAVTALFAYLQITLGGIVRVSGSGLGCPDWPLCHGRPYPPANLHAIIEYSHRTVGSLTGILIIATVVAAWLVFGRRRPLVPLLATATLPTVLLEGTIGAVVVFKELPGLLVLVHLAIALLILGLLIAAAVFALPHPRNLASPALPRLAVAAVAVTYLVLLTGSSVVATHADDACKSWPLCGGGFQPSFRGVDAYNMLHRFAVGLGGVFMLHVMASAVRRGRGVRGLRAAGAATLLAFGLQALVLGYQVATTHDNGLWNGLHLALATAVWSGMVTIAALAVHAASETAPAPALRFEGRAA